MWLQKDFSSVNMYYLHMNNLLLKKSKKYKQYSYTDKYVHYTTFAHLHCNS